MSSPAYTLTYSPTSQQCYIETPHSTTPISALVDEKRAILPVSELDDEAQIENDDELEDDEDPCSSPRAVITPAGVLMFLLAQYPLVLDLFASTGREKLGPYYVIAGASLYLGACIECLAGKVDSVVAFLVFFWLYIGYAVVAHGTSLLALLQDAGALRDREIAAYAALWMGMLLSSLCLVGYARITRRMRTRADAAIAL